MKIQKRKMILVTEMTSQEDIKGMKAADAILTSKGTEVSHAAVMATGWGKCCVVGLESINFKKNSEGKIEGFELGGEHFAAGQVISVDGHSGKIFKGELERIVPEGLPEVVRTILDWTTAVPNQLQIRANSEAGEAQMAWDNGARGIGLFRTEHAFTEEGRLPIIQEILFSGKTEDQLTEELNLLKQFHKEDFKKVLTINNGYGVTIRLLDAPLHEFAPKDKPGLGHEENPMLGFRSSRMGIMIPSIYAMQARAIFESTAELIEEGLNPHPEIELPLIIEANEIKVLKEIIEKVHAKVATEYGLEKIPYRLGTMIETPAAALSGEEIAKVLGKQGFASFGTNDMHQTTLALSRDDTSKVIDYYVQKKIMERSPFISLHTKVEKLIKIFLDDVRKPNADFEVFVCGEHGGDAYSIARFHALGLTGISMSPNRVEAARIKAAQEAIKTNMKQKSGDEPSQQKKKQTAKTNKKAPVKKHKK